MLAMLRLLMKNRIKYSGKTGPIVTRRTIRSPHIQRRVATEGTCGFFQRG
jgi:hypothetical protein